MTLKCKYLTRLIGAIALVTTVCHAEEVQQPESGTEAGLNILFFGNSFTYGSGAKETRAMNGVPGLIKRIAVAEGQPCPNVQKSTSGGKTLEWHLVSSVKTIATPSQWQVIPDGFTWDYVVLQEYSTRPTTSTMNNANPGQFKADAARLYARVADHSPKVKAILYETWARHSSLTAVYPAQFATPGVFQEQLRENYNDACNRLNSQFGKNTARIAPAGDAWEALGFDQSLYANDNYHGSNEGYLLNAMIIYRTIYGENVSDIQLDGLFEQLAISRERGQQLANTADSITIR